MTETYTAQHDKESKLHMALGIGLTLILAIVAKFAAEFPFLNIMGPLVLAILLGMIWRALWDVPKQLETGVSYSTKKLLRYGIILLGMRLNLRDILNAGSKVALISVLNITITIFVVYGLSKLFKVEKGLGLLTACGTAICGAAAVVAISPQIKAKDDATALAAATVAILGTIFTIGYTVLFPFLNLSPLGYGIWSGATLHEIAHVIAATEPVGEEAVDVAVIVKLTRVAMLVPVAILIGIWTNRSTHIGSSNQVKKSWRSLPIPWFICGFLLMSAINTLQIVPAMLTNLIILLAYLLIAMAMAGLGLNVDTVTFRRMGLKAFTAGFIGSIVLSLVGYLLIKVFTLG